MKKWSRYLGLLFLAFFVLVACGKGNETANTKDVSSEKSEMVENAKESSAKGDASEDSIAGVSLAEPLKVDKEAKTVTLLAKVNGKYFEETTRHAVIFKDGSIADKSLFVSEVSPADFHQALLDIGAKPGDNVTEENAANTPTEGSSLEVTVTNPDQSEHNLEEIFEDSNGKPIDMRFSGNLDGAKEIPTGCITCLDSCFVGITSNATYTLGAIEDRKEVEFKVNSDNLPEDGEYVAFTYTLKD